MTLNNNIQSPQKACCENYVKKWWGVEPVPLSQGAIFLAGILFLSYRMYIFGGLAIIFALCTTVLSKKYRDTALLFLMFLIGTCLFQLVTGFVMDGSLPKEMKVVINRGLLLLIAGALIVALVLSKRKVLLVRLIPDWRGRIVFPSHEIQTSYFLLYGLIGSMTIFIGLFFRTEWNYSLSFIGYAIAFSFINAILEEFVWRGLLLPHLQKNVSTVYAIVVTSIGFGLLHVSIGIPLALSILFSFGGLFYAIVVIKTKSLLPAIVFHFIINMGMVLNGWIF